MRVEKGYSGACVNGSQMARNIRFITLALSALFVASGPIATARQFTHVPNSQRPATNDEPFPSPDGREVVIESNRTGKQQLYVVSSSSGQVERRLTHDDAVDDTPTWSHDGKRIAYVAIRGDRSAIHVVDVDGHHERTLTSDDRLDYLHPTWSPDDRFIMYNVNSLIQKSVYELWTMRSADGAEARALTHNNASETTYGSWSPDGARIAYRRKLAPHRSQVFVANADGSHPRNLSNNAAYDGWPSWSPDGRRIAFSSNRLESSSASPNEEIFVMSSDGTGVRLVSRTGARNTEPRFTPDGQSIYFSHCAHHACEAYEVTL